MRRGYVNNPAPAGLDHVRGDQFAANVQCFQVDGLYLAPVFERAVQKFFVIGNGSIVDENVDAALGLHDL